MWGRLAYGVPPLASSCYVSFPPPPRLHLCHSLSQFDQGIMMDALAYIYQPLPPPWSHPETLIHILIIRIRASYQEKISPR
jgi:hypothetical protein